jgi:transcriptional regulator with XRE-family HTH domain
VAVSENRKTLGARRREAFLRNTQLASDVLRRRIRELREAKGLYQRGVAEAMSAAGVSMTGDKLCKIESGVREVRYDELLALAHVLEVPLARLMSPADGEMPTRAGSVSLKRDDVANWIVWGPWWTRNARDAQTLMRLALQIPTMRQVADDERDPGKRKEHLVALSALVRALQRASGIRPGVIEREALRAEMEVAERSEGG